MFISESVQANELRRRDVGSGREPTPSDTREPESQQEAPPGDFQGGAHDAQGGHGEGNGRRLGLGKVFDVIVSLWIFCRGSLSALGTIVKRFVFATQGVLSMSASVVAVCIFLRSGFFTVFFLSPPLP